MVSSLHLADFFRGQTPFWLNPWGLDHYAGVRTLGLSVNAKAEVPWDFG